MLKAAYGGRKGVFQVSGVEVKLAKCPVARAAEGGEARRRQAGERSEEAYRIVMPDFLARGGDGLGPVHVDASSPSVSIWARAASSTCATRWSTIGRSAKSRFEAPKAGRVSFAADEDKCAAARAPTGRSGSLSHCRFV